MKYPSAHNVERFKNHKNLLVKILRTSEQIYYENSFKKSDSPRTTWNLIKEKIGNNTKTPHPEVIINENGVELKGKDIVADYFCNYFSHINTTVELNSPESPFYSYKDYLPPSENSSMFLAPVAFGEFQKVINNLKNGNSLGIDGFSTNILKEIVSVIHVPLLHILNASISSGIFPEVWKSARVIPIHKKGDKTDIGNYRPIAILSPLSKVLEKIIQKELFRILIKGIYLLKISLDSGRVILLNKLLLR
jgi:hypothetical protein